MASRNPPASRSAARARGALLRAAREVFEARGYANTRVEDITSAAQYAVGSFYTYFDSKEDAFGEVMRQLGTDVDPGRAPAPPGAGRQGGGRTGGAERDGDGVEGLGRRIQAANQRYHRAFAAEGRLWAVVEEAALRHPAPRSMIRERWRRYWDATVAGLEPWQRRGVIGPEVDLPATVTALSAMTEWLISLRRVYGMSFPRPVAITDLTGVWLRALDAGGAAGRPPATPGGAHEAGGPPVPDDASGAQHPDGTADADGGPPTRGRLVRAARQELSRRGIGEVPISAIAATAGVSVGSFYNHFPSKVDLLAAVLTDDPDLLYAEPDGLPDDLAGAALALHRRHLAAVADRAGLWRTVVEAALTEPLVRAVVNERRQGWMGSLAELFGRWQAAGVADPGLDVELAAACLAALTERTAHLWVVLGDGPPPEEGARRLAACWWRVLAPRDHASRDGGGSGPL